jgi:sulfide dehydrogenase cytochrome subunit
MEFHMKKILGLLIGSSLVGAALLPVSAFAADKGMVLALSCASCHGTNGASPGSIPRIQGRSAEYIEKAMLQFKAGERPATVMNRIAKGYTDEEIKFLSAYLGNQSASK